MSKFLVLTKPALTHYPTDPTQRQPDPNRGQFCSSAVIISNGDYSMPVKINMSAWHKRELSINIKPFSVTRLASPVRLAPLLPLCLLTFVIWCHDRNIMHNFFWKFWTQYAQPNPTQPNPTHGWTRPMYTCIHLCIRVCAVHIAYVYISQGNKWWTFFMCRSLLCTLFNHFSDANWHRCENAMACY